MVSRRQVMKGAAAAAAAMSFMPRAAIGADGITTAFNWIPNIQFAGYFLGIDNGHFADNGLAAEFVPGGPNTPSTLVSLAAGQANVAYCNWDQLGQAISRGNDLVVIGAQFPVNPVGLLSTKPLASMADLSGKKVLLPTATDNRIIEVLFRLGGLEVDFEAVPAGFSPEPLLAGDGDAYLCFVVNQPITLEGMGMQKGKDFHVLSVDELGYKIPNQFLVLNRSDLEANRDRYVSFLRAFVAGWQDNINDPKAGVRVTLDTYGASLGLDEAQQARQNELQIPLLTRPGSDKLFWFDVDELAETAEKVSVAGKYDFTPDVHKVVDLSLLEEVLS